ncbi:hypothetical protein V0288_03105 [Pannus brasiliensis CCIBt3594]|uniref:Uncharacterized protein n=1 Tax=Pannus brasiliensis CCIBt3594 TaxID=1427578 RepID=A0AAW9QEB2_9CHRO
MEETSADTREIVGRLERRELSIVNPRRKNGVILYKKYHAEFVGPGAAIGGQFDSDVTRVLPVGKLSLVTPRDGQEKINGYLIRRQWVRLMKQIIENPVPVQRAQVILNQFENWFDTETAAAVPDEAFALLVGVLPRSIRRARRELEQL